MIQWASSPNRVFVVVIGAVLVIAGLYMVRTSLLPFVVAGMLAYALYPIAHLIERFSPLRHRFPGLNRALAVLITFVIMIAIFAVALIIVIPPMIRQAQNVVESIPQILERARDTLATWNEEYYERIPEDLRDQFGLSVDELGAIVADAIEGFIGRTVGLFSQALSILLGLAAIPLLLYYFLKDRERVVSGVVELFPDSIHNHVFNILHDVNHALGSYVRAQLILGLIVGTVVFVGLSILGLPYAVFLGVLAGLTELIPIIGPWLGAIPGIVVALSDSPEKIFWVAGLYLGVQLLENAFLVPRIQSYALDLHPIVVLAVLIVASQLAGFYGLILGAPLAAAVNAVIKYVRHEWGQVQSQYDAAMESVHQLEHESDGDG